MVPDKELCYGVPLLGDPRPEDVGAEDLHQDVELEGVGEEHGQGEQQEGHLLAQDGVGPDRISILIISG